MLVVPKQLYFFGYLMKWIMGMLTGLCWFIMEEFGLVGLCENSEAAAAAYWTVSAH
jgi:hypothetical protein